MLWALSLNWTTLLGAGLGVLSIYQLCWIIYCRTIHPYAKVQGPFLASFSRLWIWFCVGQGKLEQVETTLHQKYGYLVRIAPNELSCSDPKAVQELYRNRNPLEKTDFYTTWTNTAFDTKHPDNFSVINEKKHSARRRIVNNVYSMSNVLESEEYIDKCSVLFIQRLGEFADSSAVVDLGKWLQMYAFDVIGELYFGSMFGFMQSKSDYQNLILSLDVLNPLLAQVAVSATYARPFILLSAVAFGSVRKALRAIDHVVLTAKSCVSQRRAAIESAENTKETPRKDLLQQLFTIMREKGEKVDFGIPEIQYEAYVALFAGSDTTAIAMRSVLYHLSHNKEVYSALVEEIREAFPNQPLDMPISYAAAVKLPLLAATIKEAMRLHPSVAFTMPRISPAPDGLEIDGMHIPPGYRIGINAYILHRDRDVFGEDAEDFRPQRWLSVSSSEQLNMMNQCMLHFGGGTRTCIGKNISLSEIYKIIPQILRNFELIPTSEGPWLTHNYWFNKQTNLNFRLKRRLTH